MHFYKINFAHDDSNIVLKDLTWQIHAEEKEGIARILILNGNLRASNRKVIQAAKIANIDAFAMTLPQRCNTLLKLT